MSTLRVSNIEAKADASSPTVNEKIKITNSNGDVLVHVNGETAGVTTVGINTTGNTFTVDSNNNVTFSSSVTSSGVSTFSSGLNVTGGSVGIGTDNPDHNLHVLQSAGDSVITIESQGNGSHSALEFRRTSSAGDGKGAGSIYVTGDTSASEARMHFGVGHNVNHGEIPRLTIMGNGEVGIGTDNPQAKLALHGSGGGTFDAIHITNSDTGVTGSDGTMIGLNSSEDFTIWNAESTNVIVAAGNAEKVRITPESEIRLGYGTTISFARENTNTDYSTKIFATNNPDGGYASTTEHNYWNCLSSKGGCHIILNNDGAYNTGRTNYDHFTIFQKYWGEQNNAGKRLFSVDNVGGVQFGEAGFRVDREWGNYPCISVQRNNAWGDNNTSLAELRVHGTSRTHASWVGGADGADWSVNMRVDGGNYYGSDRRHKTNIVDNPYGLSSILQLQPRKFNRINSNGDIETDKGDILGFIAQEVLDVIPEAVNYYPDEDVPNENGFCRAYALNDTYIVSTLVNAVKELSAKNDALEARIATLEGS